MNTFIEEFTRRNAPSKLERTRTARYRPLASALRLYFLYKCTKTVIPKHQLEISPVVPP